MDALRAAVRHHPVLTAAFALAAALALWLLVEVASGLLGWPGRGEESLAPWMTIGYVGRTHDVNPRLIDATAGFPTPEEAGHPLTLAEIATRRGVPVEQVFAEVEARPWQSCAGPMAAMNVAGLNGAGWEQATAPGTR